MKTIKIFTNISLLLLLLGTISCDSEMNIETPNNNQKEYTISLNLAGEIISISETPLSKAESNNNIYGIQVYYKLNNEDSEYYPYAFGLFDNTEKLSIKLIEGYKYKFVATAVIDGKNKLYVINNAYSNPFSTYGGSQSDTYLTNTFSYSTVEYFSSLERGSSWSQIMGTFIERPELDRFYGEFEDYLPEKEGYVKINMKRTSFGIKVVTQEFNEGTLVAKIENSITMTIEYPKTESQEILTFYWCDQAWRESTIYQKEYSEIIPVSFSWVKSNGIEIPLTTNNIEFKRNKLTTITIKVKDSSIDNNLGLILDDSKDLIQGDYVNIDPSENIDTPVSPEI